MDVETSLHRNSDSSVAKLRKSECVVKRKQPSNTVIRNASKVVTTDFHAKPPTLKRLLEDKKDSVAKVPRLDKTRVNIGRGSRSDSEALIPGTSEALDAGIFSHAKKLLLRKSRPKNGGKCSDVEGLNCTRQMSSRPAALKAKEKISSDIKEDIISPEQISEDASITVPRMKIVSAKSEVRSVKECRRESTHAMTSKKSGVLTLEIAVPAQRDPLVTVSKQHSPAKGKKTGISQKKQQAMRAESKALCIANRFGGNLPPSPVLILDDCSLSLSGAGNEVESAVPLKNKTQNSEPRNHSTPNLLAHIDTGEDANECNSDIVIKNVRSIQESGTVAGNVVSICKKICKSPKSVKKLTELTEGNAAINREAAMKSTEDRSTLLTKRSQIACGNFNSDKDRLLEASSSDLEFKYFDGVTKSKHGGSRKIQHKDLKLKEKQRKGRDKHRMNTVSKPPLLDRVVKSRLQDESDAEIDVVNVWSESHSHRTALGTTKSKNKEDTSATEAFSDKAIEVVSCHKSEKDISMHQKVATQIQELGSNAIGQLNKFQPALGEILHQGPGPHQDAKMQTIHCEKTPARTTSSTEGFASQESPIVKISSSSESPAKPCIILSDIFSQLTPSQVQQLESIPPNSHSSGSLPLFSSQKGSFDEKLDQYLAGDLDPDKRHSRKTPTESELSGSTMSHPCSRSSPKDESAIVVEESHPLSAPARPESKKVPREKKSYSCVRKHQHVKLKKLNGYYEIVICVKSLKQKKHEKKPLGLYNFLGVDALRELISLFSICKKAKSCKVVLLSSVGPIFSSGIDPISLMNWNSSLEPCYDVVSSIEALFDILIDFAKPIIAAVQGPAIGLGASLLLFCDVVCASQRASVQWPHVHMGTSVCGCASYFLPKLVGPSKARSLLLCGNSLTASEAKASGIIAEVFPHDSYLRHGIAMCHQISLAPRVSLHNMKKLLMTVDRKSLQKCKSEEIKCLKQCLKSEECCSLLGQYVTTQLITS